MKQRTLLATTLALALATSATQADVFFNDPFEQARSGADWGSKASGSSALGQLEGITGQTVDRSSSYSSPSSSSSKARLPPRPAASQPARTSAAKARSDAAAMDAFVAGVVIFSIFQAIESQGDASAKAAAEAEHQRQLEAEHQRQLRLQAAARQRAAWEQQDAQNNTDLGGIFSNTGGTDFFGGGVQPAKIATGNSSSAAGTAVAPPLFTPPPPLPLQLNLLEKGQEVVRETATDLLKKAAMKSMPQQLKNSKDAVEYFDRANDYIGELFKAMSPESLVKALVDADPASSQHLLATLQRTSARASQLAFDQDKVNAGEIEASAKLLSGDSLNNDEMMAIAEERVKSSLVDKLWSRFTGED